VAFERNIVNHILCHKCAVAIEEIYKRSDKSMKKKMLERLAWMLFGFALGWIIGGLIWQFVFSLI
jgi:hypothetical protein